MSVFAAYLHDGVSVSHSFMRSVMHTPKGRLHGETFNGRLTRTGEIPTARNDMTRHWLDETDADWLWFVDTDMGWSPTALEELLATTDPELRPIVGGHCVALRHGEPDGMGGYHVKRQPTLWQWAGVGFVAQYPYDARSVVRVDGTGAAFLLIHRGAAEKLRAEHSDDWWLPVRHPDGRLYGEDLSFCYRAMRAGIPIHVNLDVRTTHMKAMWLS